MRLSKTKMAAMGAAGIVAFAFWTGSGSNAAEAKGFSLDKNRKVLAPITYKNLTLFPVVATTRKKGADYIVLDSGMKRGVVKVNERKGGGTVSKLSLTNKSDKPLFLMAGEVIVGGKQDRIIGKDTIVAAKSTETVPVFCVEHGRWAGRKASFSSAKALGHMALRRRAKFSSQSAVWKEVAKKNAMRKLSNKTQTYRHVATAKKFKKSVGAYANFFKRALTRVKQPRQVGFIVAFNGKVVAVELFGSAKLFGKLQAKLLRSYYVEAIDRKVRKNPRKAVAADVRMFIANAQRARKKRKVVHAAKSGNTYNFSDSMVEGSVIRSKKKPGAKPGKFAEEPVYDAVYAH